MKLWPQTSNWLLELSRNGNVQEFTPLVSGKMHSSFFPSLTLLTAPTPSGQALYAPAPPSPEGRQSSCRPFCWILFCLFLPANALLSHSFRADKASFAFSSVPLAYWFSFSQSSKVICRLSSLLSLRAKLTSPVLPPISLSVVFFF